MEHLNTIQNIKRYFALPELVGREVAANKKGGKYAVGRMDE